MKLKIREDERSSTTFRGEQRRYFQHLKCGEGDDVTLPQLIDSDHRVTFIRGIAGMGKSILAKQLAYGWANNELYTEFKLCILIECRELNYFVSKAGKAFEQHELFLEAVKTKICHDFLDGEGVIFVIDGLDELYDITTNDSIILPLLNCKVLDASKIILTARPHVEEILFNHQANMGGWRKVELQGLSEDEITKYVKKFSSHKGDIINIEKAKDSSQKYLPVLHIPQFLNTFCCIAILSKGKAIRSTAELYCWILYLLLKQHATKEKACKKLIPNIFKDYSGVLLTLGKLCHELLNENQIILDGDIESLIDDSGDGKNFLEGFFVDVSDNYQSKFQFKHLTLMEFLSGFHICAKENRMDLIQEHLRKGFIETVVFACQLMAGYSYDGIIKIMLTNAANLQYLDRGSSLSDTIQLLHQCNLGKATTFGRSLDIIMSFMTTDTTDLQLVTSAIQSLQRENVFSPSEISKRMHEIINLLKHEYDCRDEVIRDIFKNFNFDLFEVNQFDVLTCLEYLRNIKKVCLRGIQSKLGAARKGIEAMGYGEYEWIEMKNCNFQDEKVFNNPFGPRVTTSLLTIRMCHFSTNSFIDMCTFGISSKRIDVAQLEIADEWWTVLNNAAEKEKKSSKTLTLSRLQEYNCSSNTAEEIKMKIEKVCYMPDFFFHSKIVCS